jgi:hypothetical protein
MPWNYDWRTGKTSEVSSDSFKKKGQAGRGKGGSGQVVGHVPAYPVLRPAFDAVWPKALHATAVELENRIADYWQKTLKIVGKAA